MATTFVLHRVADYDAWRKVYESVADLQRAGGVTDKAVYRMAGDADNVLVMHRFSTMDEARRFFESADLRQAMQEGGVAADSLRVEFYDEA